jgi:hypothetical protein
MGFDFDMDEVIGTGYVKADNSLKEISDDIGEILGLTRTGDNVAVTGTETNLFIDDTPTKIVTGLSIKIDTTNIGAGDTYEFREYYRIENSGSYLEAATTITLSDAQADPLYVMHLESYRYGMKVTAKKTAGTDRSFKIEAMQET